MDEKLENVATTTNEEEMFINVCRVCLENDGELFSLYDKPDGSDLSFSDQILQITSIDLSEKNIARLPQQICVSCISDLEASYRFKMNCESSEAILLTYIGTEEAETEAETEGEEEIITEASVSEAEAEMPVDESDLYHYHYDENVCDSLENTLENEDDIKLNTIEDKPMKSEKKKDSSKTKAVRVKKSQIEKNLTQDHQNLRNHTCEVCGNSYKYRHALEVHMRRHRGDKPYKCEFCERSFVIRFELKRHMRTHTGAKPYGCRYCDRKFSDFGSRIKHERSHTGERPYICQTCGKTFAYSHVLSGHMLTHTGEKRHQCQTCGKRFTKSHHLKSHLNTHLKALNKQTLSQPSQLQNQEQIKLEHLPQRIEVIKNEPALNVSADDQDLMAFQVINTEKF